MFGNTLALTIATVSAVLVPTVSVYTHFGSFVQNFVASISAAAPAYEITASGTYDPATNQFVANTVSVVL